MSEATSDMSEEREEGLVEVLIRLRPEQRAWAKREHVSLSPLLRELLDEEIERRSSTSPGIRRDERERARTR